MAGTNNKPRKFTPGSPVIPGRGVDWQIGANQPERDTYKLLRELERNKAEIGTIILTPPSQDQDALIWNGSLLRWENSQKYITTQPKALGRNVISPTGDFSALKLQRFSAGQTNPIQTWETEGGTALGSFGPTGALTVYGGGTAPTAGAWTTLKSGDNASALAIYDSNNFLMYEFPAVLERKGKIRCFSPAAQTAGVGIEFNTAFDGGSPKFGAFGLDTAGNMVFSQSTSGSMYFDYINGVNFRNGSFANVANISSSGSMTISAVAEAITLRLKRWDVTQGSALQTWEAETGAVMGSFGPKGTLLLAAQADVSTLRLKRFSGSQTSPILTLEDETGAALTSVMALGGIGSSPGQSAYTANVKPTATTGRYYGQNFIMDSTNLTVAAGWVALSLAHQGPSAPGTSNFIEISENFSVFLSLSGNYGEIYWQPFGFSGFSSFSYNGTAAGGPQFGYFRATNCQAGVSLRNALVTDDGTGAGFRFSTTTDSPYSPLTNTAAKALLVGNGQLQGSAGNLFAAFYVTAAGDVGFQRNSSTAERLIGRITGDFSDSTDATRKGRFDWYATDATADRKCLEIGTSGTAAMIGFLGAAAVVQPSSTTDLRTALINLGLYATGGASPLDLNGGALTTGATTHNGDVTVADAKNIVLATTTGTKIGTATTQKLGFFNAAPVVQQAGASAAGIAAITDANAKGAVQALQTALANLGLVTSPA